MLEIFGIMMLCKANRKTALARGHRPGGFIALTIILWVGMEIIGLIIGTLLELEYAKFLFAYGMAGLGALISWLIVRFIPEGKYVDPNTNPVDVQAPLVGTYNVPVNQNMYAPYQGAPAGGTPVNQYGMPTSANINEFGMPVDENGKYSPVLDQYGVPVDTTATAYYGQPAQNAAPVQAAPAQQAPVQHNFCGYCGAKVEPGSTYCESCGAKLS